MILDKTIELLESVLEENYFGEFGELNPSTIDEIEQWLTWWRNKQKCSVCKTCQDGILLSNNTKCLDCGKIHINNQPKTKPTLGLAPSFTYIDDRMIQILDAANRHIEANKKIPIKWIKEYNKLIEIQKINN